MEAVGWIWCGVALVGWALTVRRWGQSIDKLIAAWRESDEKVFAAWRAQIDDTFGKWRASLQAADDSPLHHQAAGCLHTQGVCNVRRH